MREKFCSNIVCAIATAFLIASPFAAGAQDFEEDPGDDVELSPIDSLVELAAVVVEDNCVCPEDSSDAAVKKFDACLAKHSKKANKAFKASLRYLSQNSSEFNEVLQGYLSDYKDDCLAGFEELPPEDEFPEDEPLE